MSKSKKTEQTPRAEPPAAASAAPFDAAAATPIDPARRHEPTGRTIAWEQAGYYYSATGDPVAPVGQKDS